MSSWDAFAIGLSNLVSWPGILIPTVGTLLAMVAAFLPGLGNASVAVIAMVLTLHWEPTSVLLLFGALTGGATFMGSITAILFNIPGSVSSTPALLDGYPLSKRGLTRTAIACAATASAIGSVFGVLVLLLILPIVEPFILKIGPLEMLLIGLLGLLTVASVTSKSPLKSAVMVGLGLMFSLVGSDPLHGMPRWNFGFDGLGEGIGIVPLMIGIFTISELIEWMSPSKGLPVAPVRAATQQDSTKAGVVSVFQNLGLTVRASSIGTLVGMVPGIGGTVAGFVAYGHAAQSHRNEELPFGQGNIKGLIAPEAAVDAKDGGSLLPTLALGLPGSEACVILLGVFSMHGLVPGTPMLTTHLALTYTLILALLFSNLLTSVVGVALAPTLAKLGGIRIDRMAFPCLLLCIISALQLDGQIIDIYLMLLLGVLGYFWRTYDWPKIPFVIAFVLGRMIEKNLELTIQLASVGRIDSLKSIVAVVVMFTVLVVTGWIWIRRSRYVDSGERHVHGLGLSALALGISSLMLAMACLNQEAYSTYPMAVALITVMLSAWALLRDMRGLLRQPKARTWLGDLASAEGHRHGLGLIIGMLAGIWLLGLSVTVGMALAWWLQKIIKLNTVRSCLLGGLSACLLYWALSEWLRLSIPIGWFFEFLING